MKRLSKKALIAGFFGLDFGAALLCACTGTVAVYTAISILAIITLVCFGTK